jgi:hypothetical protein
LDELASDDLELTGGGGGAEEGRTGRVEGRGLDVFVEVGRGYGADPVIAALERPARAGAGGDVGGGGSVACCWVGLRRGIIGGRWVGGGGAWLALRVVITVVWVLVLVGQER